VWSRPPAQVDPLARGEPGIAGMCEPQLLGFRCPANEQQSVATPTGRERTGSPTLQKLREPISLLRSVCFRGGGFPSPKVWGCCVCASQAGRGLSPGARRRRGSTAALRRCPRAQGRGCCVCASRQGAHTWRTAEEWQHSRAATLSTSPLGRPLRSVATRCACRPGTSSTTVAPGL
jgi:hypothetical protein